MKKRPIDRFSGGATDGARISAQAACSQAEVSNALLISGMFIPNDGLAPPFDLDEGLTLISLWAVSLARSHDPISWERATEKNRSI